MSDIVFDTAKRLGVQPKALFRQVASEKGLTEATADSRFEEWFKHGSVPDYIQDWCLDKWEPNHVASAGNRASTG